LVNHSWTPFGVEGHSIISSSSMSIHLSVFYIDCEVLVQVCNF
jgi:hypothetical protein